MRETRTYRPIFDDEIVRYDTIINEKQNTIFGTSRVCSSVIGEWLKYNRKMALQHFQNREKELQAAIPETTTNEPAISDKRLQIIIALISCQDVRKWDEEALYQWASAMANRILQDGT